MSTITLKLTDAQIIDLKKRYPMAEYRPTPDFALFQFKLSDCVITAYVSKKVVFAGKGAELHASSYSNSTNIERGKAKKELQPSDYDNEAYPQCGSDEVGTGDYFGPVVVCAACVKEADVPFLKELQITDSKMVLDKNIRILAPQLMARLTHSLLILNNTKYNEIHPASNLVEIKCKLHNQAYVQLKRKMKQLPRHVIIDQFTPEKNYYTYLKNEKEVIQGIHFETKAESRFLAVAAASVIARYALLLSFDAMCERYDFQFLKGAGPSVDKNIIEFLTRYQPSELKHVAKLHFANTKKANVTL